MTHLTDHLTKLTCAAGTARDLGYVHTVRALDRMIDDEKSRLKVAIQPGNPSASPVTHESETSS